VAIAPGRARTEATPRAGRYDFPPGRSCDRSTRASRRAVSARQSRHSSALNGLADEAGAETGRLQRELNELKAANAERDKRIDDLVGEITLLRALQPKKLLQRKSGVQQIEGSLSGAAVN
jgi:hypothetical protein